MPKKKINIVWLRRDLRLSDHQALQKCIEDNLPCILLYIYDKSIMADAHFSNRHWRFAYESLQEMNKLIPSSKIHIVHAQSKEVFSFIFQKYDVKGIYSHHEVALDVIRKRDDELSTYFRNLGTKWSIFTHSGIIRNAQNRNDWLENRTRFMAESIAVPDWSNFQGMEDDDLLQQFPLSNSLENAFIVNEQFQKGGTSFAQYYLQEFIEKKHINYLKYRTKPYDNRLNTSCISPYLSFGCISMREVEIAVKIKYEEEPSEDLKQFLIHLFDRSHHQQKLESEPALEFFASNRELEKIRRSDEDELYQSWLEAKTGYPIIDASMKELQATGFTNLRLRSTLVTFATFTLWQDWRKVAQHLASLFLDFDPGLHFGKIHEQAGLTGYHTLRLYSPEAQASKHDPDGLYVKKWLPELRHIPKKHIVKPWLMELSEQKQYRCILGENYPNRIVDFEIATQIAKRYYWELRQTPAVYDELPAIFKRHCLPQNIPKYMEAMKINKAGMSKK